MTTPSSPVVLRDYHRYATEEERLQARRKQKNESKRRLFNHAKFHNPVRYEQIKAIRRKHSKSYYLRNRDTILANQRHRYAQNRLKEETEICEQLKEDIINQLDTVSETNDIEE